MYIHIKQKPRLTELGDKKRGTLIPCDDSRAQVEDERLLFSSGKDSINGVFVYYSLPNLLFPFIKSFSFPSKLGNCTVFCCGYTKRTAIPC